MEKESFTEKLSKKIGHFKICLLKIAFKHDNTLSITLKILKRGEYLLRFTKESLCNWYNNFAKQMYCELFL